MSDCIYCIYLANKFQAQLNIYMFVFNIQPIASVIWRWDYGGRMEKLRIELASLCLQGEQYIHYNKASL